jgi:hypothetical protein
MKTEIVTRSNAVVIALNWAKERRPAAITRFMEGEARLLWAQADDADRIKIACNKLQKQTGMVFAVEEMFKVRDRLLCALDESDVVAFRGYKSIPSEHQVWLDRIEEVFNARQAHRKQHTYVTAGTINRDLHLALGELIKGRQKLSVISSRNIAPVLKEVYGVQDVRTYQIPSQHVRRLVDDNYEAKLHNTPIWPDFILDLERRLEVREPGEIYLIGAGLFGKHLAVRIRSLGGFALDLGSEMDRMVGKPTRGAAWREFEANNRIE